MNEARVPVTTGLPTAEAFLKTVLRSGLLDRAGLQAALRGVPRPLRADPLALADHLVRTGKLTRYQAHKLLSGASRGLLLGPFQVLAPIGRGGMGTVYLARDSRGNQLVALKVLPPRKARGEDRLLARFRREMALSQLTAHPHLAWTYDVGQWHGVHYLAMEYIPGQNLARRVAERGPLEVARAARLLAEVALGLEHAHNHGLVHRDLKPSNIMVTPHDHAKVLDLGLALRLDEDQPEAAVVGGRGYVVGTMDYIAPEQTTDPTRVDARSDVYSLGCTLYYALSGQPPFPGGSRQDKIERHRRDEPASLLDLRPGLPPGFVALVRRMMAKDPARRFPSAIAAEEELRAWAGGEPALPLDRPDDSQYAEAVCLLQTVEPSGDISLPDVPGEVLPEAEIVSIPRLPARRHPPNRGTDAATWVLAVLLGSLGFVLVGGILVAVLLLLRHRV